MSEKIYKLALIGRDVSFSTSPQIHTFILGEWGYGCEYEKFSVTAEELDTVMPVLLGDFDAFNVTIPYKREVFSYLDEIVDDAFTCGAANTVVCSTRKGYNTDGKGFVLMLETEGVPIQGRKALVLGVGGAGRSIALALKDSGADVYIYRRDREELMETSQQLHLPMATDIERGGFDLVVNCTGVGMHDTEGKSPVQAQSFQGATWAIDLIYHPKESAFLSIAKAQGVRILNGEGMLFYQAYYADCLYVGKTPDVAEAKRLYIKYKEEK